MARMPSTRAQPLNPHVAGLPVSPTTPFDPLGPVRRPVVAAMVPAPSPPTEAEADAVEEREAAARAGGFHESSYELKLGLDVSESEWPDDTTVPGALGRR